jgi:hypothetical protein
VTGADREVSGGSSGFFAQGRCEGKRPSREENGDRARGGLVPGVRLAVVGVSALQVQIPRNMPFGVTGSSPVVTAAESTKIMVIRSRSSTRPTPTRPRRWRRSTRGRSTAPISPGRTATRCSRARRRASSPTRRSCPLFAKTAAELGRPLSALLTVPSISDLAPYTLGTSFQQAAKSQGQTLTVTPYTPTPLAHGDPFGLVLAILLTPLLLCGYISATLLKAATKVTAALLGAILITFAIVATLIVDLIAGPWLGGVPGEKFWILWPIMALTMSVAALFAAVVQRLLGAAGKLLTVFVNHPAGQAVRRRRERRAVPARLLDRDRTLPAAA